MKVYLEFCVQDRAITRIADAIKKYLPLEHELVSTKEEADLVFIASYRNRRYTQKQVDWAINNNKKYAIVQVNLRGAELTKCTNTAIWRPMWERAEVVWSFHDLVKSCQEEQTPVNFNFYYAPLGVESDVFKETKSERKYLILSTGSGRAWNKECKNEILLAVQGLNRKIFQLGTGENTDIITYSNDMDDETLAKYYSQCEFVSGLRRVEGFELPIIEGLLCGARPICFDTPNYRHWFNEIAEFIPEDTHVSENLRGLFDKGVRPVAETEKEYVKTNFNWEIILQKLWKMI